MRALVLPVADERYLVALTAVREVVTCAGAAAVTPLPAAPAGLLGLLPVRGEVVPLFDVQQLRGGGRTEAVTHVVVLEVPVAGALPAPAALAVTALPSVAEVEGSGATRLPEEHAEAGRTASWLDPAGLLADRTAGCVVPAHPSSRLLAGSRDAPPVPGGVR